MRYGLARAGEGEVGGEIERKNRSETKLQYSIVGAVAARQRGSAWGRAGTC